MIGQMQRSDRRSIRFMVFVLLASRVFCEATQAGHVALPPDALASWKAYSGFRPNRVVSVGEQHGEPTTATLKARGESRILVWERQENGKYVGEVSGRNDKYLFRLERKIPDGPWVLTYVGVDDPGTNASMPRRMLEIADIEMRGNPVSIRLFPLPSLIAHPSFRATEAQHFENGLYQFRFQVDPKAKNRIGQAFLFDSGRVLLDPEKSWLPVEYELASSAAGTKIVNHNSDFHFQDGFWFPRKTSSVFINRDGKSGPVGSGSMQVNLHEQIPESEFTLSAFGLPEPHWAQESPPPQPTRWWLWAAVTGIGLLVLAVALRGLSRRRSIRR